MADCSCIKGEGSFNFELKAISSSLLVYTDLSDWMEHPNYKNPSNYMLTIQPPHSTEVDIMIDVTKANKITPTMLGKEGELPDGIYCMKLTNCGYTYTKYVAIVRRLECCADKLFMENKDTKELDELIRLIKVSVEFNNISEAQELYKQAEKIIKVNLCYC